MKTLRYALVFCSLCLIISTLACNGQKKSPAISSDGVAVAYESHGEGTPTLVLVHGWSNNRTVWDDQVDHFSQQYRVVTLDLPGFGQSGRDREGWTMTAFGEDVGAVVEALDLDEVILVGFSMGTAAVLEAAAKMPDRVEGVVLVDQLHNIEMKFPPQAIKHVDSLFMDIVNEPSPEKMGAFFRNNREESYQRVLKMLGDQNKTGWRQMLANFLNWRNDRCWKVLTSVNCPVYAINSESEPTNVKSFRKYVPTFEAEIVPDVGHLIMWDAPDQFNQLLEGLIERIESHDD